MSGRRSLRRQRRFTLRRRHPKRCFLHRPFGRRNRAPVLRESLLRSREILLLLSRPELLIVCDNHHHHRHPGTHFPSNQIRPRCLCRMHLLHDELRFETGTAAAAAGARRYPSLRSRVPLKQYQHPRLQYLWLPNGACQRDNREPVEGSGNGTALSCQRRSAGRNGIVLRIFGQSLGEPTTTKTATTTTKLAGGSESPTATIGQTVPPRRPRPRRRRRL